MTDDLIKRVDAIKAVWKPQVKPNELIFDALKTAIESEINNVPSAQPKQGEWVIKREGFKGINFKGEEIDCPPIDFYRCSNCDHRALHPTNFCSHCGADMREREGE